MISLFDSHAHLGAQDFAHDVAKVVERAVAVGVRHIANCTDSLAMFAPTLALKKQYPQVCLACLGIHPQFALQKDVDLAIKEIKKQIDLIDAIGEVGLDYDYTANPTARAKQRQVFLQMCDLALEYKKPLIVHSRAADDDVWQIIAEKKPPKVDLHCFTGTFALAQKYLQLGIDVRFGFTGIITFKNALALRETATLLPLEKIMIETDSPVLSPVPFRRQRNEPKNLLYILKVLSNLRFEALDQVAATIYESSRSFYGLVA